MSCQKACWAATLLAVTLIAGCHSNRDVYQLALEKIANIEKTKVDVVPVQRGKISSVIKATGTLIPVRSTNVAAEVDGKIISFLPSVRGVQQVRDGETVTQHFSIDLGTEVRQGDVLFTIDPTDYQMALDRAEAALRLAEKSKTELMTRGQRPEEITQLKATIDQAKALYDQAESDYRRMYTLVVEKQTEAKAMLDSATAARDVAKANAEKAEAAYQLTLAGPSEQQLAVCDSQIAAAQVEVNACQDRLRKTKVLAPYDAVVVARWNDIGNFVRTSDKVLQIIDMRVLFAEVTVPQEYQSLIKYTDDGDRTDPTKLVAVYNDLQKEPYVGKIDIKNAMVDPETRCVRVRVTVENYDQKLHAGTFVRVAIPIDSEDGVLVIPRSGIMLIDGNNIAYVDKGGVLERRVVQTGLANDDSYEVKEGLAEGEHIVVGKLAMLADGQHVLLNVPASQDTLVSQRGIPTATDSASK
ncbi:MAG: efflux RND transporter periplasmic adaptor subunit [Planctomycetaceae bacterium]|nr:efflux RND transporter periplasmic adaptor subunit [Planctomycetaceae bacterium]